VLGCLWPYGVTLSRAIVSCRGSHRRRCLGAESSRSEIEPGGLSGNPAGQHIAPWASFLFMLGSREP
jgi:hypothetical protein